MTIEQFKRSNEIQDALKILYVEKTRWEDATCFDEIKLATTKHNYHHTFDINIKLLDFEKMKAYVLREFNTKIEDLENEFKNL